MKHVGIVSISIRVSQEEALTVYLLFSTFDRDSDGEIVLFTTDSSACAVTNSPASLPRGPRGDRSRGLGEWPAHSQLHLTVVTTD